MPMRVRSLLVATICLTALPLSGQGTPTVQLASRPTSSMAATAADSAIEQLELLLTRYPNSPLRANALFQIGELLVRRADDQFAAAQRSSGPDSTARSDALVRPDYAGAIARYEELVRRYPNFEKIDAAAYTLGTLYSLNQRYGDAVRMFEIVSAKDSSRFQGEALFRLGDAYFEIAAKEKGDVRRATFAKAATAYERATARAPQGGDIYLLSLYKLGWSHYNQATAANQAPYNRAVEVFGQLVDAYDKLSPEQQSRLGLRGEAIEYMAVAFTQVGGADAATKYFASRGAEYKLPVLRRVAQSLRDQGDFTRAVEAYEALLSQSPNDSTALDAQREIVDIYQNRMLEPDRAQQARLQLVERFAPGSAWAQANPGQAADASKAREDALRQSGQYLLNKAQQGDRAKFAEAAQVYERYLTEFSSSDSAQVAATYLAEAHFGQGDFMGAGSAYSRAAYGFGAKTDSAGMKASEGAGRNAIVAFDSALVRNKTDRAAQDSLFAAVDRFANAFPQSEVAKKALISKAKRASETQRWDVMAETFRNYVAKYPNDPYTPTAQKSIGDALYKQGLYAEAQVQWDQAQAVARSSGRTALADSIGRTREAAAGIFADTLVKKGEYRRAAEEVYVAFADKNPGSAKAPDALRDAIETYMIVIDSGAARRIDAEQIRQARERAIELSARLVTQYPTYKYRLQYQSLNARLLADAGKREEAVEALRKLIADNPGWSGRADAQSRLAGTLDSLGRKADAAAEYAKLASMFPNDKRAPDALYNAAVTYVEAGDTATAARTYAAFASRYPRDSRAAQARALRVSLLTASGDTASANAELARLCVSPTADLKATCSGRVAEAAYRRGLATFQTYRNEKLVIATKAQLTAKGIQRAAARKQQLQRTLTAQFESAIRTGNPEYLAASTYYIGLAQWEYGDFFKNVQLPGTLTDEERTAGEQGSARQAEQFYEQARKTWQALVDKAEQTEELKSDAKAMRWVDLAKEGVQGKVPETPPTSARPASALTTGAE